MNAEIIAHNLKTVLQIVTELSTQYGIAPPRLVAVSKTFPAESVSVCYQQQQRHFAENYLNELEEKAKQLGEENMPEIRWHFIGRLQSNKIKRLCNVPGLWCVETVEKREHCDHLQSCISQLQHQLNIFIQVNTSGEAGKGGVIPNETSVLAKHILLNCPNLRLLGLMSIGSLSESSKSDENSDFELLRSIRNMLSDEFGVPLELSMGMSSDYQLAIKYGSTNIRVGSAIFGHRIPKTQ